MNSMRICETEIRTRIRENGKITFAEFMELALFHPQDGYYTRGRSIGAEGDYFTSSTAHPAFGALIALQVKQMWELLGSPSPFYLVEMGAGGGLLAKDILSYSKLLSQPFKEALQYVALDRRPIAQSAPEWIGSHLQPILTTGVPFRDVVGCFLSNELLDAFPVHRFKIEGGSLKELYVTLDGERLVEIADAPSTPLIQQRLDSLAPDLVGGSLSEGFRGEVNLGIGPWMQEVTQSLSRGFVITIDYGYAAQELYSPQRSRGTLQCYYMHTQSSNPYVHIGQQDITAHVDFTTVMREGEKHGLSTLGFATQRDFLTNLGMQAFMKALRQKGLPQHDYYANRMGMQELVQPNGLGNFKVLVQSKGLPADVLVIPAVIPAQAGKAGIHGLTPGNELVHQMEADLGQIDLPLLSQEHTPLMEGRYPHQTW